MMGWKIFFQATNANNASTERDQSQQERLRRLAEFLPMPSSRPYHLLATDATPVPRRFARTLQDRQIVHYPNPSPGNKPIVVGHHFSTVTVLPEKESDGEPPWAIPIRLNRIPSKETDVTVATRQIRDLMTDAELPFSDTLTVNTVDSRYGIAAFLSPTVDLDSLVTIARSRANRVFYHQHVQLEQRGPGRPKRFGKRFDLKKPSTWENPDEITTHVHKLRSGEKTHLELNVWKDMLMRGKRNAPMHDQPFTLIKAQLFRQDRSLVFKRPLWLIVHGKSRGELSSLDVWKAYRQRYDIEHFFRFGKRRLLLNGYQTPVVEHEENWWEIVGLAYLQLWIARDLAISLPNPWEKYSKSDENPSSLGPSQVQRDWKRIIQQIEGALPPPKPRGKSSGRSRGDCPGHRDRHPIIFKGKKKAA